MKFIYVFFTQTKFANITLFVWSCYNRGLLIVVLCYQNQILTVFALVLFSSNQFKISWQVPHMIKNTKRWFSSTVPKAACFTFVDDWISSRCLPCRGCSSTSSSCCCFGNSTTNKNISKFNNKGLVTANIIIINVRMISGSLFVQHIQIYP